MVEDAEAAGFNPLTAIRNGGSAGFTTTTTPGLSSSAFIFDAIGQVGNIVSNYDPMAKATAELEHKIRQETLRNLQADTAQRLKASIGGVPVSTGGVVEKRPSGRGAQLSSLPPETQTPTRTNPFPTWMNAETNPWMPDMEAWETHMGDNEIASMVGTVLQLGQNVAWNGFRAGRGAYRMALPAKPLTKMPNYGKPYSPSKIFQ